MATSSDRRAPGAARVSFDAMVEVGGALGPSFEAQALNLSEEGMSLRTTYLPEVGQPITCRFDAGHGAVVIAAGEVLWKEDMGEGGEFGIRFTNLDAPSTVSLQRILGMAEEGQVMRGPAGRKVRLHIDGLASPMRARVKNEAGANVTAYSDLGFLQLGKPLELEDARSQARRPALIDRVEVEVERDSRVPQLIVTLRYDDEEGRAQAASIDPMVIDETGHEDVMAEDVAPDTDAPQTHAPAASAQRAAASASDIDPGDEAQLKSAFARGAAKARVDATVAFEKVSKRAKTTLAMLAAKMKKGDDIEIPIRRTTSPPPDGALHASGRKVVRGSVVEEKLEAPLPRPRMLTKKKVVIASALTAATLLAFLALRKPPPTTAAASSAPPEMAAAAAPRATTPPPGAQPGAPSVPTNDPLLGAANGMGPDFGGAMKGKNGKPVPFGNGPVAHGNVLKLKMDGPIGAIQGASSPTGFTVTLPGRKSIDSASPLAAKDARIAAIKVANETGGAELTVTFKDGVPNYQVKAHGDTLEMHLAKAHGEAHAKKKKHH